MMEDAFLMAKRTHDSDKRDGESGDELLTETPVALSLEQIIDITGEFEHLNDLVMIQIEKEGGFSTTQNYFKAVEPILDLLEVEIRVRYRPGMSKKEMKLVVQDWIDEEIAELR